MGKLEAKNLETMYKNEFWYNHVRNPRTVYLPQKRWFQNKRWETVWDREGDINIIRVNRFISYEGAREIVLILDVCTNYLEYRCYYWANGKRIYVPHSKRPDNVNEMIHNYINTTQFSKGKFTNGEGDNMRRLK